MKSLRIKYVSQSEESYKMKKEFLLLRLLIDRFKLEEVS